MVCVFRFINNSAEWRDNLCVCFLQPSPQTVQNLDMVSVTLCFLSVFHVAPPSSPTHLLRQQFSPASCRLQDKHQKLRESRQVSNFLPPLPPLPPSSSSDPLPFRCHDDDLAKPKGKRLCKMKHTGGETAREEEREEGGSDGEDTSGKVNEERLKSNAPDKTETQTRPRLRPN